MNEFGNLTLTVDPQVLSKIIADGRIVEFTSALSQLAAEQIPAQVVDHLVRTSASGEAGQGNVQLALVLEEGGGFGVHPHLPIKPPHPGPLS